MKISANDLISIENPRNSKHNEMIQRNLYMIYSQSTEWFRSGFHRILRQRSERTE